eukprot:COSAG02_NODE_3731_length_6312_cov_32.691453_3_plen_58_part_00
MEVPCDECIQQRREADGWHRVDPQPARAVGSERVVPTDRVSPLHPIVSLLLTAAGLN